MSYMNDKPVVEDKVEILANKLRKKYNIEEIYKNLSNRMYAEEIMTKHMIPNRQTLMSLIAIINKDYNTDMPLKYAMNDLKLFYVDYCFLRNIGNMWKAVIVAKNQEEAIITLRKAVNKPINIETINTNGNSISAFSDTAEYILKSYILRPDTTKGKKLSSRDTIEGKK